MTGPPRTPPLPDVLWQRFESKATALSATVERVASVRDVVGLLARDMLSPAVPEPDGAPGNTAVCTAGCAAEYPEVAAALRPTAARIAGDAGPECRTSATEVVGVARFAVAETGSVVLATSNEDRGACFLADRLWLLLPEEGIVPTLDEALSRVAALVREGAPYVTFMSGPSRTADIERTLTIGVHGPRALTVVVIGGDVTVPVHQIPARRTSNEELETRNPELPR